VTTHLLSINNRAHARVPVTLLEGILDKAIKKYGGRLKNIPTRTDLVFLRNAAIANLNKVYRKKKGPTDVLSFSYIQHKPWGAGRPLEIGDIFIAPKEAEKRAKNHGNSLRIEIGFLFLHGVLHILGFDHEKNKKEESRMARAENALIKAFPELRKAHAGKGLILREGVVVH
jgi:probable rRNA maturation factor